MSDSNSSSGEPSLYGPRINSRGTGRNNVIRLGGNPGEIDRKLMSYNARHQQQRDLYDALGYVKNPQFEHFEARYKRGGAAGSLVDKLPSECWAESPTIDEHESDSVEGDTAFEAAVESFMSGEHTRAKPLTRFRTADEKARLGRYSLILLGVDDDPDNDSVEHLATPVDTAALGPDGDAAVEDGAEYAGLDDILYLSVYDESDVDYDEITFVTDPTDERFNLPESYSVDLGNNIGEVEIHHSRVVHVCEGGDLLSDSVLLRSLNRLDDLEKIIGGGAEGYWRANFQAIVWSSPDTGDAGLPGNALDAGALGGGSELAGQIEDYRHNLSRQIYTNADFDTIGADVESPLDHVDVEYQEIAAGQDLPQSIIKGNETGERATEQDKAMLDEATAARQRGHCEDSIARLVWDRLREWGVLPELVGDGYDVEWPARNEPTEQEQADVEATRAQAMNKASGGSPERLFSDGEIRQEVFGYGPERGSEVDPEDSPSPMGEGRPERPPLDDGPGVSVDESDPAIQAQAEELSGRVNHDYWLDRTPETLRGTDRPLRANVDFDEDDSAKEAWDFIQSSSVNMTASQVEQFKESTCGENYNESSDGSPYEAANRAITVLQKDKSEWTSETVEKALKMKSYHSRHKEQTDSDETVPGECDLSPNAAGLMMWAHDPVGRYS